MNEIKFRIIKKIFFISLLVLGIASCTSEDQISNNTEAGSNLSEKNIADVSYGTNQSQKYDIYLPANRTKDTPIILLLHGGAWKAGQKEELNSYVNLIKGSWKNVAIVNMNYRLSSNANNIHHNEIMSDITMAINHVLANLNEYQISPNMGIVGGSAGGQLAMIYAYKYNTNKTIKCVGSLFGPTIINDWEWYNSNNIFLGSNIGVVLTEYVGQTWDETIYKSVSPYWNITSSSQPTILFHGNLDPIVPVYQSQWMNAKLNTLNVPHEYHEYIAFHGFDGTQSQNVTTKLVAFFKVHLK